MLFGTMMVGADRCVDETWVMGKRPHKIWAGLADDELGACLNIKRQVAARYALSMAAFLLAWNWGKGWSYCRLPDVTPMARMPNKSVQRVADARSPSI